MNQNIDIRITKTDKLIREAFLELANTIGFEKITVMNLTKKAMISRTTFYSHYKDKYDVLEQIENELLSGMKNIVNKDFLIKDTSLYLLSVYKYVEANKEVFKLFMCNNLNSSFYFKFHECIRDLYNENINSINIVDVPENYAIALIASVHTGIIREWIKSGMKESPEELSSMFINIIRNISNIQVRL